MGISMPTSEAGRTVSDVHRPFLIGRAGLKVAIKQIGSHRMGVFGIGGGLEFTILPGADAVFTHQSGYSLQAMTLALGLELCVNTRTAVGPAFGLINGLDLHQQQAAPLLESYGFEVWPEGKCPQIGDGLPAQVHAYLYCFEKKKRNISSNTLLANHHRTRERLLQGQPHTAQVP